jgi:heme O synthase-like polyprenyltransferase
LKPACHHCERHAGTSPHEAAIIELLLITTVPTMVVVNQGILSGWLTNTSSGCSAGGANAINMYVDRTSTP